MPSSYTNNLGIELPADGELDAIWGDVVNDNMGILDRAINGTVTLTLSGTSSTLTTSDGTLSDGQYKLLVLAGSPSGTHTITIAPNDAQKIYFVRNTTAQSVVFTQGSGGNVTIATGDSGVLYADGAGAGAAVANLTDHFAMSSVKITGGSIDGAAIGGSSAAAGSFTTGSFSGDLTIADKIVHSGDVNTAIRFPAADTVTVETGGVERLRVDSSGNVGIGASLPTQTLTVNGTIGASRLSLASVPVFAGDPENRIINGAFDFWQRGTSQTTNGYGSADRWQNSVIGGTVTMSRQSFAAGDTLGSNNPAFFLRHTVSGQSLAADLGAVAQSVEGVRSYAGQTITVLGWARRSSGSGNMAVEGVQSFGTGGSPSATITSISPTTVSLTGSWAPFAAVMTIPSITGKTLGSNGNDRLIILFWTSAGSDYNARTNSLGLQTISVDLWGIHIKEGTHTVAAVDGYRAPELGPELARCQRYFCVTRYNNRFPATATSQVAENYVYWPQQMRATPTTTLNLTGITLAIASLQNQSIFGARAELVSTGAGDARLLDAPVTADAEL
jgi:hypothetical protein